MGESSLSALSDSLDGGRSPMPELGHERDLFVFVLARPLVPATPRGLNCPEPSCQSDGKNLNRMRLSS